MAWCTVVATLSPEMKRPREEDTLWTVVTMTRSDLEKIVRATSQVSETITMRVRPGQGLEVEAFHPSRTCLLRAKLQCEATGAEKEYNFTCFCRDMLLVLKSAKSQYPLVLSCPADSSDCIQLHSQDELQPEYASTTTLQTLACDIAEFKRFETMHYDYVINLDAAFLKTVLANNQLLGAEHISLSVLRDKADAAQHLVRMECRGERSHDIKQYLTRTEVDSGSMAMAIGMQEEGAAPKATKSTADFEKQFEEAYRIPELLSFIKSMDSRPVATLKLGSQVPMLVEVALSSPDSAIYWLTGAVVKDD